MAENNFLFLDPAEEAVFKKFMKPDWTSYIALSEGKRKYFIFCKNKKLQKPFLILGTNLP